ncbi:MAG: peptide deformylase [Bradymonadia bacterium]
MALRTVLHWPDERLKHVAEPVTRFDDALRQLVVDMAETMYDEDGVGLAATQIGVPLRVVVMDCYTGPEDDPHSFRALINPEIISSEGQVIWNEGCLSVPGIQAEVERAAELKVRFHTADGELREIEVDALEAVCIQHEIDHLNGVVFIEHLGAIERAHAMQSYDPTAPKPSRADISEDEVDEEVACSPEEVLDEVE